MKRIGSVGIALAVLGAVIAAARQKAAPWIFLVPAVLAAFSWLDLLVDRQFQKNLTPARRAAFHRLLTRLGRETVPPERVDRMLAGERLRNARGLFELVVGLAMVAFGLL